MTNESDPANDSTSVDMPQPTAAPRRARPRHCAHGNGGGHESRILIRWRHCVHRWARDLDLAMAARSRPLARIPRRCIAPPAAHNACAAEVERLRHGMPGYRLRLPVKVHPVSAGVKGGIVGGLVMPLPAMAYGLLSGHGIWWPVNLLAGMMLPGIGSMSDDELAQFHLTLFVLGLVIHAVVSLILGLIYGVLMPTLPNLRKPLAWGALLMPLLWTAVSYVALAL